VALSRIISGQLLRGQTNFLRMLFKFSSVYDADRFYRDHERASAYAMRRPSEYAQKPDASELLVHLTASAAREKAGAAARSTSVASPRATEESRSRVDRA